MLNARDILETITMIQDEHLDVRTITMGISLLDCCHSDIDTMCGRVYDKITRKAKDLVKTGEQIEKELGIPIINKRISVTPAAMILAACDDRDAVKLARLWREPPANAASTSSAASRRWCKRALPPATGSLSRLSPRR